MESVGKSSKAQPDLMSWDLLGDWQHPIYARGRIIKDWFMQHLELYILDIST
jgi:hypothetical protein